MKRKKISHEWYTVLKALSRYEDGIDRMDFIDLIGEGQYSHANRVRDVIGQMFWDRPRLYDHVPDTKDSIKITEDGLKAIERYEQT
jgi:hypothetical protein